MTGGRGFLAILSCGLGIVQSPLESGEASSRWTASNKTKSYSNVRNTPPAIGTLQPQLVMSEHASPAIGTTSPASLLRIPTQKMPFLSGRDSCHQMAFWILFNLFFLLQAGKAICIHLISRVLVTGASINNFIAKS